MEGFSLKIQIAGLHGLKESEGVVSGGCSVGVNGGVVAKMAALPTQL